jgi:glutamate racemase
MKKEITRISKPTVVLGDVHGLTYWKEAVAKNPDCRYIFLGDYLDPYKNIAPKQLIDNLKEIIQLKKDRGDDVILLLGNHDLHYFCPKIDRKNSWKNIL